MIPKNINGRTNCIKRRSGQEHKEAKTSWLRLAYMLTGRLAYMPITRWAQVLVPIGTSATQIVKVKSQKREQREKSS